MNIKLPKEIVEPVTKNSLFSSLIASVLVVFLINLAAIVYLKNNTTNRGYWLLKEKWEMLFNLQQPVDWLLLGDSSCNQGVVPDIFDKKLEVKSINLCTLGNMSSLDDAWMLNQYIKRFGAPKNVLIVHTYSAWDSDISLSLIAKTPLDWGYWQQMEPPLSFDKKDTFQLFINRYLPLYSENQTLASLIKDPVSYYQLNRSFQLDESGFMIWEQADVEQVKKKTEWHIKTYSNKQFNLTKHNHQALETIAELAQQHNFNVYLANAPIYQGLYAQDTFRSYYRQIQDTLNNYAANSERVNYILQQPMTFPQEQMENTDHVTYTGAQRYTEKLASEIYSLQKIKERN